MKIAAISDTHVLHWSLEISKGAILVHTGADNFSKNNTKTAPWAVFVLSRTFYTLFFYLVFFHLLAGFKEFQNRRDKGDKNDGKDHNFKIIPYKW